VAGATFIVPGLTRPAADTIVVRITLHTPSVARGRVLLPSGTDHAGTIVGCPPAPPVAVTAADGEYVLDLLPLGRWTITLYHSGFGLGLASIDITTPGDTLEVGDVHLSPGPVGNTPKLRIAERGRQLTASRAESPASARSGSPRTPSP
jgi:hypothetical protein